MAGLHAVEVTFLTAIHVESFFDFDRGFDGETAKDLELWEKAYKEFPNDCRVMKKLMYAIWSDTCGVMPEERMKRTIELGETILS